MKLHNKLLTLFALSSLTVSSLSAETTMCFKENHTDFKTIEKVALDGGLCSSKKSVTDMKNDGWSVDDIKISGSDYVYIFKKSQVHVNAINIAEIERKVLASLTERDKAAKEEAKREYRRQRSLSGQRLYVNKCQNCHGEKGEKLYGPSRALNTLDLDEFVRTMRDYTLGEYDRGQAFVMVPYANTVGKKQVEDVYVYIQSKNEEENDK